jgi:hypothetical protein
MVSPASKSSSCEAIPCSSISTDHAGVDGSMRFPTLLILAPTPPPFHGVSVATQVLLTSDLAHHFHLVHIELADRRGIAFVDKPDILLCLNPQSVFCGTACSSGPVVLLARRLFSTSTAEISEPGMRTVRPG